MSVPSDLQFYFMHFMPYIHVPDDVSRYPSLWVDFPNAVYDPHKGAELYDRYISELVEADRLSYDGLVVNEHHSTAYSMMPACNLIASILTRETRRAKICVFGTPVNLEYPNRLAEEYAMLDVLAGGRLECAFPAGTGMEYWAGAGTINPVTSRRRMAESIDILLKSWTQDGPTTYDGEFYSYRYLNVWPKPMQKPHPRLNIVSSGGPETLNLAAEKGFGYSSVFVPIESQLRAFEQYRQLSRAHGHTPTPDKILFNVIAYVAETDELAEREAKEHILWYFNTALRTTPRYLGPPGSISSERLREQLARPTAHGDADWDTLREVWRIAVGSSETVASLIERWVDEAQAARVICNLHIGTMPHWMTIKNLTLFAEEVMPRLRHASAASAQAERAQSTPAGARS